MLLVIKNASLAVSLCIEIEGYFPGTIEDRRNFHLFPSSIIV